MEIITIGIYTLKKWLDDNEAVIIDVREIEEYKEDCIKGAINIPLAQLLDNMDIIKSHSDKKIVMQCRVGVRSLNGCKMLHLNGFDNDVYNLDGGIISWRNSGFLECE